MNYPKKTSMRYSGKNKENAPEFIYRVLYGKRKEFFGRTSDHKQKLYNGVAVDEGIPDSVLDKLNSIKEIELRSSCMGESNDKPTFLIFRFKDDFPEEFLDCIQTQIEKLGNIKCGWSLGNMKRPRFGVTWKTWYGKQTKYSKPDFDSWWKELPGKIETAIRICKSKDY